LAYEEDSDATQLTSLLDSIGKLVNLTELDLDGNPIKPMTETEMIAAYGEVVNPIIIEAIIAAANKNKG